MDGKVPEPPRDCRCGRADCERCTPIEAMLRASFVEAQQEARVPSPDLVWYRAQMRARDDAARAAARPLLFTQALAIAALLGLVASLVGRLWMMLPAAEWHMFSSESSGGLIGAVAFAVGAWLILAPLAAYLVFSRD